MNRLQKWLFDHRDHCHGCGPWQDAKIHIYYRWVCSCGDTLVYTDADLMNEIVVVVKR